MRYIIDVIPPTDEDDTDYEVVVTQSTKTIARFTDALVPATDAIADAIRVHLMEEEE
jgi:hypothetical protein